MALLSRRASAVTRDDQDPSERRDHDQPWLLGPELQLSGEGESDACYRQQDVPLVELARLGRGFAHQSSLPLVGTPRQRWLRRNSAFVFVALDAGPVLPSNRRSVGTVDSDFNRRRGVLLGLAVGDALGAAVEFETRGSFPPVSGYRSGGPHGLAAGEWTDDTSMALALADSIASAGWDLSDQAARYLSWWQTGKYSVNGRCFDIGVATREALARIAAGNDPASAGDAADEKSGNGSIMRLAPVSIRYLDWFPSDVALLADHARQSSQPTHRSSKCLSACRYLSVVLAALISGQERDEVLSPDWPALERLHAAEPLEPAILEVARGSYRHKRAGQVRGSGYVVHSLEAALWAFFDANSFRDAVLAAVNLGDDADTTGAVCGQLAGAYFGAEGIPAEWLEGLAQRELLEDAVQRLCRAC